jgi:hypothetical protein
MSGPDTPALVFVACCVWPRAFVCVCVPSPLGAVTIDCQAAALARAHSDVTGTREATAQFQCSSQVATAAAAAAAASSSIPIAARNPKLTARPPPPLPLSNDRRCDTRFLAVSPSTRHHSFWPSGLGKFRGDWMFITHCTPMHTPHRHTKPARSPASTSGVR